MWSVHFTSMVFSLAFLHGPGSAIPSRPLHFCLCVNLSTTVNKGDSCTLGQKQTSIHPMSMKLVTQVVGHLQVVVDSFTPRT